MSESATRTVPVAAQSVAAVAQTPETKTAPERVEDPTARQAEHAVSAAGGSPQTPPDNYSVLLSQLPNSPVARTALLRRLQSTYGNSYVGRVIQRTPDADATGDASTEPSDDKEEEASDTAEGSTADADAGGVPAGETGVTEKIEGEPLAGVAGCDQSTANAAGTVPTATAQTVAPPQGTGRAKLDAHFALASDVEQGEPESGALISADMVEGTFNFSSQVVSGDVNIPDSAHGYAEPTFEVGKAKWETKALINSVFADTVVVNAPVKLTCRWNVQSRGKERIFTAQDEAVNYYSWSNVARDLQPDGTGKPPRELYWAPKITQKHELFHTTDYIGASKKYVSMAEDWFRTQSVDLDGDIDAQVNALLAEVKTKFEKHLQFYLQNGGEERAYADGKQDYETLVNDIKQRASAENWPQPPSTAKPKTPAPKTP